MPKFVNEVQDFRHRGYKVSADPLAPVVMVFGDGPEPASADGSPVLKLWDHDVSQVIKVSDHIEAPAPADTVAP